jgi:hypothetical protein
MVADKGKMQQNGHGHSCDHVTKEVTKIIQVKRI